MKYINIEQALEVCRNHFARCWENHVAGGMIAENIKREIEDLPEVDAVEVVRCKDCAKCLHTSDGLLCTNPSFGCPSRKIEDIHNTLCVGVEPEHFCSYGKRDEDGK